MGLNNTQAVLQAYVNRLQELENAAWGLLSAMGVDAAVAAGASDLLNKLGAIVGEDRLGRSDADYGAGIKLKIRTNNSSGRATDIVEISMLAYAPSLPLYLEGYPAAWLVDMPNLASGRYVAEKLGKARAAGTRGLVQFTTNPNPVLVLDWTGAAQPGAGVLDWSGGSVVNPGQMSAAIPV